MKNRWKKNIGLQKIQFISYCEKAHTHTRLTALIFYFHISAYCSFIDQWVKLQQNRYLAFKFL